MGRGSREGGCQGMWGRLAVMLSSRLVVQNEERYWHVKYGAKGANLPVNHHHLKPCCSHRNFKHALLYEVYACLQ